MRETLSVADEWLLDNHVTQIFSYLPLIQQTLPNKAKISQQTGQSLHKQIVWADAYIVTYAINDLESFNYARNLLDTICALRGSVTPPILLLANKKDLDHNRQVSSPPLASSFDF